LIRSAAVESATSLHPGGRILVLLHHIGGTEFRLIKGSERPIEDVVTAAAIRGDARAVQQLWDANRRWIAAVLLAHKPRQADLEDLLQDVAATLVGKVHTLREEANVRAWLRTVAINAARAAARSSKTRDRVASADSRDVPDPRVADRSEAGTEEARETMQLVLSLPEAYREPLMLKALHNMRTRQISEILGLPEATVDTRISRARRMVRERRRLSADDELQSCSLER
jgi:RNA polymerase sigma-70 factor (ECF subfamily)